MPWRELLLESHSIAVLSAASVALLAFPGTDLAKSAQPRLARVIAAEPVQQPDPTPSKGPEARLTGKSESAAAKPAATVPVPASKPPQPPTAAEPAVARPQRAFEGCLQAYRHTGCRRAFEALIERNGGFTMTPGGERLGSQRMSRMSELEFDEAPRWRRRVESLSENGIALKRVRRGNSHELTFGINRDGVLGFSLEETAGR